MDRAPAAGHYPVPGPGDTVLRSWDGASWSNHFEPGAATPLPAYRPQPWRWLAFPGWLLGLLYAGALAGATLLDAGARDSIPARIWLAACVGCATAIPVIALLILFDRRISFGQLGRTRTAIIAWGIAGGIATAAVAIAVAYAVTGRWHAPLLSAADVPGWLVGLLQGPLKFTVPVALWASGRFRVPRQGFLLVIITAMSFAIAEATADVLLTGTLDHRRTGTAMITVLVAAIAASVPWRAAWRRHKFLTWPAIAAIALAMALHWLADTLIVRGLAAAALGVAAIGYLAVKVAARQLVPPDRVAMVSRGWRPSIGTMLSPDSPLLSHRGLVAWLKSPERTKVPAFVLPLVRGASWASIRLLRAGAVLLGLAALAVLAGILVVIGLTVRDVIVQRSLDPFYETTTAQLQTPGTLLRTEPMTAGFAPVAVPGGTAYRMLYTSSLPDGTVVPAGGMVFVPSAPSTGTVRPVLAWAHPTMGEGDGCAPSRSGNPLLDMQPWLTLALQRGWVVVATDYAGVGTQGTPLYLVGGSEARDVLYAVQAARQFDPAEAGTQVAVFGHSQGGHSALWTGLLAGEIAPDLQLVGVAAAAPAAELTPVFNYLWNGPQAWLLSPDVVQSWTAYYPKLTDAILTPLSRALGPRAAQECLASAAVQARLLWTLGLPYTVKDPLRRPGWALAAQLQTPGPLQPSIPMLLVQSTGDQTIPPATNAQLQIDWCRQGSTIDALWLSGISHVETAVTASPAVIDWMAERFAGQAQTGSCQQPPPMDVPPPTPVL